MIILIGLPGSGKTTVARLLARRLQLPFVDADAVLEQRLGCSIRSFFEREGEARFRALEQALLAELCQGAPCVLSTGGGAVLLEANRAALRAAGRVFYLRATPEEVYRRIQHDRSRPLLQVADPLQKLRQLFAQRDPLYRDCAHHSIDSARLSVPGLVNAVARRLERAPLRSDAPL